MIFAEDLYSTAQAAQYLNVHVGTIKRHLYQTRLLKPSGKLGGRLFFTRDILDTFDASRPPSYGGRPLRGRG